jgi:hypothetical protein
MPRHGSNPHNLVRECGRGSDALFVIHADIAEHATSRCARPRWRQTIVFNLAGQVGHIDSMNDPLFDLTSQHDEPLRVPRTPPPREPDAVVIYTWP